MMDMAKPTTLNSLQKSNKYDSAKNQGSVSNQSNDSNYQGSLNMDNLYNGVPATQNSTNPQSTSQNIPVPTNVVTNETDLYQQILPPKIDFPPEWVIPFEEIKIFEILGKGNFGIVSRGMWNNYEVAIKQLLEQELDPNQVEHFIEEGKLMMKISPHDNVLQLYGVCVNPICLIVPYCSVGNLEIKLYDPKIDIPPNVLLSMAVDLCNGLAHLHKHGIIHRDLAARNLLLSADWRVKICDFGMSRVSLSHKNYTNTNFGPLKWMAPEAISKQVFSYETDVFSLGVTLSEIFNRCAPYPTMTPMEAAVQVVKDGERPSIPGYIPQDLQDLIWNCWETDPSLRDKATNIAFKISVITLN